jgi:hypothetical protein
VERFADGAVGCNNPVRILCEEAKEVFMNREIQCVISLGSGSAPHGELRRPRIWERTIPTNVISALKFITTEVVSDHELTMKDFRNKPDAYYRFNVDGGMNEIGLEEWARLGDVRARTIRYLRTYEVNDRIEKAAKALNYAAPNVQEGVSAQANPEQAPRFRRPDADDTLDTLSLPHSSNLQQFSDSIESQRPDCDRIDVGRLTEVRENLSYRPGGLRRFHLFHDEDEIGAGIQGLRAAKVMVVRTDLYQSASGRQISSRASKLTRCRSTMSNDRKPLDWLELVNGFSKKKNSNNGKMSHALKHSLSSAHLAGANQQ